MGSKPHPQAAEALAWLREDLRRESGNKARTWAAIRATLSDESHASAAVSVAVSEASKRSRSAVRLGFVASCCAAMAAFAVLSFGIGYELGSERLWVVADDRAPAARVDARAGLERPVSRSTTRPLAALEAVPEPEEWQSEDRPVQEAPMPPSPLEAPSRLERVVAGERHRTSEASVSVKRTKQRRAEPMRGDLEAEMKLVTRAAAAWEAGERTLASDLLRAHLRRFPGGQMAPERRALQILISCGPEPSTKAKRRAQTFLQRHPNSPYAKRIRSNCRVGD